MNDKWKVIPSELARIFISLEIFELGIGFQTAQWFKTEGRGGEMDEIVAPCWICLPLKGLGLSLCLLWGLVALVGGNFVGFATL